MEIVNHSYQSAARNMESKEDIVKRLSDRDWRVRNLYYIKDSSGKKILFKPNLVQEEVLAALHEKTIILKARKHGITTLFAVLMLDDALFHVDRTNVIVAHLQQDQVKIFRNIVKFSFDNVPEWLKEIIGKPKVETSSELYFENGSSISVALNTRSGTPTWLHSTELAYTARHFPDKARELVSGSFNSVAPGGMITVESTPLGKGGIFYNLCIAAMALILKKEKLTNMDFKLIFLPWYNHPEYILEGAEHYKLPPEMLEYFEKLEEEFPEIQIPIERKRFYAKKWEQNLRDSSAMYSEFPSCFEEAFKVNLEGAFFGKECNAVYKDGRLGFFPYDPRYQVWTAWDIGVSDFTAIVFFQVMGEEIRIIDFYQNNNLGSEHYIKILQEKEYRYDRHIFPHDIGVKEFSTGVTRIETMVSLGIGNYIIAPKISISDGIDRMRLIFRKMRFDQKKAGPVLDALSVYRKKWNDSIQNWSLEPVHDENSHICDAIRYMSVVYNDTYGGMYYDDDGRPTNNNVNIVSFFE